MMHNHFSLDESVCFWSDRKLTAHFLVMMVGVWWFFIPSLIFSAIFSRGFGSFVDACLVSAAIILWFFGLTWVTPMVYLSHTKDSQEMVDDFCQKRM